MVTIILWIWTILSVYAIYYVDNYCYWEHLFKIFITISILAFIFNGWQIYNPSLNHMLATVELNPTWNMALGLSLMEGTCITGPIAGIYILKEKIKERRG